MKKWETRTRGDEIIYAILNVGPLSISVHRQINSSPTIWFLSCDRLGVYNERLDDKELDQACCQAEVRIYGILKETISVICRGGEL